MNISIIGSVISMLWLCYVAPDVQAGAVLGMGAIVWFFIFFGYDNK